jgi:hypothetical protein
MRTVSTSTSLGRLLKKKIAVIAIEDMMITISFLLSIEIIYCDY